MSPSRNQWALILSFGYCNNRSLINRASLYPNSHAGCVTNLISRNSSIPYTPPSLPTGARFLIPTKEVTGGDVGAVDENHAVVQPSDHCGLNGGVIGIDVAGQPEFTVIGHRDGATVVFEGLQHDHRVKDILPHNLGFAATSARIVGLTK
ncbi:hypothetical protein PhaeoP97_03687 (plasmid) [Phaeobacter porticola]|uniref:Uncharacterized protein n=1 Tax=Phaeobacter porticola TaxID=1844006 RepID=A0A1L3IA80_9RHOB|nr:hypothetical protein PhaeoP97_03687 [Phaeobacter porticola]